MKIQFESSTLCNARCSFCPHSKMTRPMGTMSDTLFHKIIKEGKEMGIRIYSPFLNGEPFVFPKIYEWLDYMLKEKVLVSLYTNAEYLDVDKLLTYPNIWKVNCSFNGATKETYEKVMGLYNFEKTRDKIKDLINRAKFGVSVSMVVNEDNVHEKRLFREMWGDKAKICYFVNWGGDKHSTFERKGIQVPCYHLLHDITILWDGRVNLCCMDYDGKVILGDLNKQTLKEIIGNIELLRIRHKVLDFNMPLCKDCNLNV